MNSYTLPAALFRAVTGRFHRFMLGAVCAVFLVPDFRAVAAVAPLIDCPANIVTNAQPGSCAQTVAFSANVTAGDPAPVLTYALGTNVITSPHSFPNGTNVVTVTATNGELPDATCQFTVVVLESDAPRSCVTPPAGMAHWWPGDGADDLQGGPPATLIGPNTGYATGKVGTGFNFVPGDLRGLIIPSQESLNLDPGEDFSVDFWMRTGPGAVNPPDAIAVAQKFGAGGGYQIYIYGLSMQIYVQDAQGNVGFMGFLMPQDTISFRHYAISIDRGAGGAGLNVYVDGVVQSLAGSSPDFSVLTGSISNASPFFIGTFDAVGAGAFDGVIDEFEFFNRALSQAEVQAVVHAGSFGKCKPIVATNAPGQCSAVVNFTVAAGDDCSAVTVVSTPPSGSAFPTGTTTVTNVVTDAGGNAMTNAFTVTVLDVQAPQSCVTPPASMSGWWPGDGSTTDLAAANHGALINGATYAAGLVGQAFSFDGANDRVDVPFSAGLNITGDKLTLAGWIKPVTNGHGTLYFGRSQSSDHPYMMFFADGGIRVVVKIGSNQEFNTGYVPATNVWTHLAMVYDGAALKLYANGAEVFATPLTGSLTSSTLGFGIGNRPVNPLTAFHGLIDEVQVFNRALAPAEVVAIHAAGSFGQCKPVALANDPGTCAAVVNFTVPFFACSGGSFTSAPTSGTAFSIGSTWVTNVVTDGLGRTFTNAFLVTVRDTEAPRSCVTPPANMISWWPGDGNLNDLLGNNTGTPVNGIAYAAGLVGQAMSFNGVNQYVNAGTPANLNITGNQVTIDGWIRPASFTGDDIYFGKTASSANSFLLIYQFSQLTGMVKVNGVETIVLPPVPYVPPLNQWTHLALTYDGALVRLFVNGEVIATAARSGNITGDASPFCIGGRPGGIFFNGQIDEVEVFNRALSTNEIRSIYLAGSFGKCKPLVVTNDPGQCSAVVNFTLPLADNCPGASLVSTPPSGSTFAVGTTTVTSIATDAAGNTSTNTLRVTVRDTAPPTISAPADVLAFTGPGAVNCGAVVSDVTLGSAITSDNCAVAGTTRSNVPPGNLFPVGVNLVTYRATDASTNFSVIVTQRVVVLDNTAPVITCPDPITVTATGACPIVVTFATPTVTDNCSVASVTLSPPSGSAFAVGTNTVTVTATDGTGNIKTCAFTVTVLAGPPPALSIFRSDTNAVLSWPDGFGCYTLQATPELLSPAASNVWVNAPGSRVTNGGVIVVTNSAAASNRFYRLTF